MNDIVQRMFASFQLQDKLGAGQHSWKRELKTKLHAATLPVLGLILFFSLWSVLARNVETSLGAFPGPIDVAAQTQNLYAEHRAERDKAEAFYLRQKVRNQKRLEADPEYKPKTRKYTGKETFWDQIVTSLKTVLSGYILAILIAIPLGVGIGLSDNLNRVVNPIIQIFKPVSPLAWLPLVTIVVSAVYVSPEPLFEKSFINSMITVTLCCLWPIVINTSAGVSTVNSDWLNVSRILKLPLFTHLTKVIFPASIPSIFVGLRLSLGIAWMVLIAAEMLAQNPGLGKFVWDEFQNGSSQSLSRIMVAVLTIGLIGVILDKAMILLQNKISWVKTSGAG